MKAQLRRKTDHVSRWSRCAVGTLLALPCLAAPLSSSATPPSEPAARQAYYAIHYAGEHGPFASRQGAIDAALRALGGHAASESWWTEWLTLVTRDRFGKWWYSSPKEGQVLAARQCQVSYSIREIRRPGSTLVSTAHTHPRGDVFPDPRPTSPDNQNPHEMFLLRSDGNVWFFKPHEMRPKLYGHLSGESFDTLESRYVGRDLERLRRGSDPEAIRPPPPPPQAQLPPAAARAGS